MVTITYEKNIIIGSTALRKYYPLVENYLQAVFAGGAVGFSANENEEK